MSHPVIQGMLVAVTSLAISLPQVLSAADLLRFVHRDARLCLHAKNLTESVGRLESSELVRRFQKSVFFEEFTKSGESRDLESGVRLIESFMGQPLRKSFEELLGKEFVCAVYFRPNGSPAPVLILDSENPQSTESLLKMWSTFGGLESENLKHHDTPYVRLKNAEQPDAPDYFYAVLETTLIITEEEDLVQRTIDVAADGREESYESIPSCREVNDARDASQIAVLHVNPRTFDSDVVRNRDLPQPLQHAWKRCLWISLQLNYDEALTLDLTADYDATGTPEWWNAWVALATAQQLPLDRIPDSALISWSGGINGQSIADLIQQVLPAQSKLPKDIVQSRRIASGLLMGMDPVNDLLPMLGPSWLMYAVPRDSTDARDFPVDSLFALELNTEVVPAGERRYDRKQALDNALLTGLNLMAAALNSRDGTPIATVQQKNVDGTTIRWAEPVARFRPAFAVSNRHLLVATSPELIEQFLAVKTKPAPADQTTESGQVQFLSASSTVAREILSTKRGWFLWQAGRDQVPEAEAQRRLTELDAFLGLIDRAWLSTKVSSDAITLTAGIAADATQP